MKFTNGVFFGMLVSFVGGGGFHVQELQAVLSFMYTIYGSPVRGFGEDKMSWKPDRNKRFMVNDYYSLLVGSNDFCFPWKSIWKLKTPS